MFLSAFNTYSQSTASSKLCVYPSGISNEDNKPEKTKEAMIEADAMQKKYQDNNQNIPSFQNKIITQTDTNHNLLANQINKILFAAELVDIILLLSIKAHFYQQLVLNLLLHKF